MMFASSRRRLWFMGFALAVCGRAHASPPACTTLVGGTLPGGSIQIYAQDDLEWDYGEVIDIGAPYVDAGGRHV